MFTVNPIHNEEEYKTAFKELDKVWDAKPNTPERDTLELLLLVIEAYEAKHHPMPVLDPIDAIKYKMEEEELTQQDLVRYFGSKQRVSEVLNRKRNLTLKMIKNLYHGLRIPANVLLSV